MEIVMGILIGLGIGLALGFVLFRKGGGSRETDTSNDLGYMEVIRVLIGLKPGTRDYLGDMVKALVIASTQQQGEQYPTRQELLSTQEGLLMQLRQKFGLSPAANIQLNDRDQLIDRYDSKRHLASGALQPGMSVVVQEPGWKIRGRDGRTQVIKKAKVIAQGRER